MKAWPDLTAELDAWHQVGRRATLWWRDDDAVEPSAALDRLLALARRHDVPLMLAVIPARATPALACRIAKAGADIVPVQHGYAHVSHAPPGERNWELGTHRPLVEVLEELTRGRARMGALFAENWLPVMVPPWNRIAPEVAAALGGLGYRGLSAAGARGHFLAGPGVVQVNAHADIMRWNAPRGFLGVEGALKRLLAHLGDRRLGRADEAEPTGILTHHLAHDAACWEFLERLLGALRAHPAVDFVTPREAFSKNQETASGTARGDARGAA